MRRLLTALLATAALAALAGLAGLAGCDGSDDPAAVGAAEVLGPGGLAAAIVEDGVRIRNLGSDTYYVGVFREGALALFTPCLEPGSCQAVQPGQAVLIAFDRITAWDEDADAAEVFFWRLVANAGGDYRAEGLGSFIVRHG